MSTQTGSVVVTGAARGMTNEFAHTYHKDHPDQHIFFLLRNPSAIKPGGLPAESDTITYVKCNLDSLGAVHEATKLILTQIETKKAPQIEAIVLSATVQNIGGSEPRVTKDGYEETMAVNYMAHYALILDLLPSMKPHGRVVIVGSDSHKPDYKYFKVRAKYEKLDVMLKAVPGSDPPNKTVDNGRGRYATSKLCQMMSAHELSRRLRKIPKYQNIHVAMYDPGSMGATGLFRDRPWIERKVAGWALRFPTVLNFLDSDIQAHLSEDSAEMLKEVTEDPKWADAQATGVWANLGGAAYYDPWGKPIPVFGAADEPQKCEELWDDTANLLGYTGERGLMA